MIPDFDQSDIFPLVKCHHFHSLVEKYKALFCMTPGVTTAAFHSIPMNGSPAHVPPCHIPAHLRDEVEQIQQMLELGIIEENSSPWMAPDSPQ